MAQWYDKTSARLVWADAPRSDEDLDELLEVAREQVVEFATSTPFDEWSAGREPGAEIPIRWRRAQLLQARANHNFMQSSPQDTIGGDAQTVRVYPMDWNVKALLRPKRAMPGIG